MPLQSNLSQNEGNPMVKRGCYCKCKAFLHDEVSRPPLGLLSLSLLHKPACFRAVLEITMFSLTPREWNKIRVGWEAEQTDEQ